MRRTREVLEFEARFEAEEFDIIATVAGSGWTADRLGRAEYYTAGVDLLSWISVSDGEAHSGRWRLSCKADEDYYRTLRQAAPSGAVVQVRVRQHRMSLLAVSLPRQVGSDTRIQPPPTTPHTSPTEKKPGALLPPQALGHYQRDLLWRGRPVQFRFTGGSASMLAKAQDTMHALLAEPEAWDNLLYAFAASRLPAPTGTPLSAHVLSGHLTLRSVETASRGRFTFRFAGDDLFAGRDVLIEGNLKDGPKRAELTDSGGT